LVLIVGRKGTGKTSLLRFFTGLGDREVGMIQWKGEEVEKSLDVFHQDLLFLCHQTGVKRELTACENLRFYQTIQNN
ncbi:ATP-binding cassette domain-containing protein, partial [Vibrio parahaemolyticus]|uniref:ATP-binding cassette domain-containing protein n=1 Tax=Vibrio parahaemolyticus TaxID=670 RepID=UPI0021156322